MTAQDYAGRLSSAVANRGNLCVGIDPHVSMLEAWGLPADASGLERCARGMVEALGDRVAIFKPQSAMFEVFGSAGIAVLERVLDDCRAAGAMVLLDAKRGDIGSTMAAYAAAYLTPGSPLEVDALTVNPFLGFGSLQPAIDAAAERGKGLYVLCRTSNPEGGEVQSAVGDLGHTVGQAVADACREGNMRFLAERGRPAGDLGPFGLVVGGTHHSLDVDLARFNGSILVPGIGAQGGTLESLRELFGEAYARILPTTSRDIMKAGPDAKALRTRFAEVLGG
ncbi:orotidine-5'-phosphate decarboxylase [Mariniluteicoccus flavus]